MKAPGTLDEFCRMFLDERRCWSAPRRGWPDGFRCPRCEHAKSQRRAPVGGVYLCGARCHPGGGVSGLPSRSAAREVLNDGY
jgi:phytoene dehydrogenase-like protein